MNFKKTLFSLVLVVGFATQGISQGITLGVDAGYSMPVVGPSSDALNGGFGGELRARFYPKDKYHFGVNVGLYMFPYQEQSFSTGSGASEVASTISGSSQLIPITLGYEYYFLTKVVKPYAGLDAGLFLYNASVATETVVGGVMTGSTDATNSGADFGVTPNVGVMFGLSPITNINVGVKYPIIFGEDENGDSAINGFLTFQAGIHFTLGL